MSSLFETWPEVVQLLAPLAAIAAAGYSFWIQSKSEKRATQILRKAAEAELMKRLIAASTNAELLDNDLMRRVRDLEIEAEQLHKLIAEAKLAANQARVHLRAEARNGS